MLEEAGQPYPEGKVWRFIKTALSSSPWKPLGYIQALDLDRQRGHLCLKHFSCVVRVLLSIKWGVLSSWCSNGIRRSHLVFLGTVYTEEKCWRTRPQPSTQQNPGGKLSSVPLHAALRASLLPLQWLHFLPLGLIEIPLARVDEDQSSGQSTHGLRFLFVSGDKTPRNGKYKSVLDHSNTVPRICQIFDESGCVYVGFVVKCWEHWSAWCLFIDRPG